jgi:Phage DNA packaging protein, Nu1 subunit of terminase
MATTRKAAKTTAKKPFFWEDPNDPSQVSAIQLAAILKVNRETVTMWIKQGCPTLKDSSGPGDAYVLSVPAVVEWRIQQAVNATTERNLKALTKTRQDASRTGGKSASKEASDEIKAQAQANIAVIEEAERRRAVAPVELMQSIFAECISEISMAVQNIPYEVERNLPPGVPRKVLPPIIQEQISIALEGKVIDLRASIGPLIPYDTAPISVASNENGEADDE